jgi:hypothetical protein
METGEKLSSAALIAGKEVPKKATVSVKTARALGDVLVAIA